MYTKAAILCFKNSKLPSFSFNPGTNGTKRDIRKSNHKPSVIEAIQSCIGPQSEYATPKKFKL